MRSLASKPNVHPPDSDYPYARLKDRVGSIPGTPINEFTNGDLHQFFEKLMDDANITPNELPENAYSGFQLNDALNVIIQAIADLRVLKTGDIITGSLEVRGGIRTQTSGSYLLKKIIPIGPWNMDTTSTLPVPHGLSDYKKIRNVSIIIRDDSNLSYLPIDHVYSVGGITSGTWSVSGANIDLVRSDLGIFDQATFSSTTSSYNRGFITIEYEA